MSTLITSSQHYTKDAGQCHQAKKERETERNKRHPYRKVKSKTVFIETTWNLCGPDGSTKKITRINAWVYKFQVTRSIYKNQLYFYILTMNSQELKLKEQWHL